MKTGDVLWRDGTTLSVNGRKFGTITDYNASTGTYTFKRFSLCRRAWYWFSGIIRRWLR